MSRTVLMCRGCGHFVPAIGEDESLTPIRDSCPKCDGGEFKEIHTGTVVRADDS